MLCYSNYGSSVGFLLLFCVVMVVHMLICLVTNSVKCISLIVFSF